MHGVVMPWIRKWFFSVFRFYRRIELRMFSYSEADQLLKDTHGCDEFWRLANEEDTNFCIGVVWMEKVKRITA